MRCSVLISAVFLLTLPVGAQIQPDHAVVATAMPGAPATVLLDIDLTNGAVTTIGRFPSDVFAPLAVRIDPANRDLLVVVAPPGQSRVLRLKLVGTTVVNERTLTTVSGVMTGFSLRGHGGREPIGDLLAVAGGQLLEIPRNGGTPRVIANIPRATVVDASEFGAAAWVGESGAAGPPVVDPQFRHVDVATGTTVAGPVPLPGAGARTMTGISDRISGIQQVVISLDDGAVYHAFPRGPVARLDLFPAILPGGAAEVRLPGRALVLGGRVQPFVKTFNELSGGVTTRTTTLAGPLPGDPVSFDQASRPVARVIQFGLACAAGRAPHLSRNSFPTIGNAGFELTLSARPNTPAVLALGISDQAWQGLPLPLRLPAGGCLLYTAADVTVPQLTDAAGSAQVPVPIPNLASLDGLTFFAQWLQPLGPGLEATFAGAVRMHR